MNEQDVRDLVRGMLSLERRGNANRMIDAIKKHSGFAPGCDGKITPFILIQIAKDLRFK